MTVRCAGCPGEVALQNVSKNLRNSHLGMTLTPDSPDGFLVSCFPDWGEENANTTL